MSTKSIGTLLIFGLVLVTSAVRADIKSDAEERTTAMKALVADPETYGEAQDKILFDNEAFVKRYLTPRISDEDLAIVTNVIVQNFPYDRMNELVLENEQLLCRLKPRIDRILSNLAPRQNKTSILLVRESICFVPRHQ